MIAHIDVDPTNPNRLFVAVLGHPYGPNAERGIFRSTDGGRTFQKVLYKDEYTSGNDVRIDPTNPNIVYATLWQQQQSFIEGQGFGGGGNGIFKSTDGGTTWKQLTDGLPSDPAGEHRASRRAIRACSTPCAAAAAGGQPGRRGRWASTSPPMAASTGSWSSTRPAAAHAARPDTAAARRASAAATCRPSRSIRRTRTSSTAASVVFWRTEDGGLTWSAVRGAPGGDDYQGPGSTRTTPTSSSPWPTRARWCRPIAA